MFIVRRFIKTPLPMLTKEQIIPYLDTYVRSFEFNRASEYVNISSCHRVIAHVLLRRHYRKVVAQCIRHTFEGVSFSPETIRRAVKDGVDMGMIERMEGGDRRLKRILATQLLVDNFEVTHVESTD